MTNMHRMGNGYPLNPGKVQLGFVSDNDLLLFYMTISKRQLVILRNLFLIVYKNNTRGLEKISEAINIKKYAETDEVLENAREAFVIAQNANLAYCCVSQNLYFKIEANINEGWVRLVDIPGTDYLYLRNLGDLSYDR